MIHTTFSTIFILMYNAFPEEEHRVKYNSSRAVALNANKNIKKNKKLVFLSIVLCVQMNISVSNHLCLDNFCCRLDSTTERLCLIKTKLYHFRTPTIDGTDGGTAWPKFTSVEDSSLLHIDSERPKLVKNPFAKKYKFWSSLPLLSRLEKSIAMQKQNVKNEL